MLLILAVLMDRFGTCSLHFDMSLSEQRLAEKLEKGQHPQRAQGRPLGFVKNRSAISVLGYVRNVAGGTSNFAGQLSSLNI